MLDQITEIKLQVLGDSTHEDPRGDPLFLVSLIQCSNQITKIQHKINQAK